MAIFGRDCFDFFTKFFKQFFLDVVFDGVQLEKSHNSICLRPSKFKAALSGLQGLQWLFLAELSGLFPEIVDVFVLKF